MPNFEDPFNGFSKEDREMMESGSWYIKAREKIGALLPHIDPDLEVDVQESVITPNDKKDSKYQTITLAFTHKSNPDIRWTMEIKKDDDYIENDLEDVVRKIYKEQKGN